MATGKIGKFRAAMETVYGDTESLQNGALESWVAPPNSGGHRGRYLWTDAFGVLNFLSLYKELGETRYLILAKRLVTAVHDTLGWTRDGKRRLPGATDENVVGGGLRIGKIDEGGIDGDGQYHHYLTLWMFALNRLSIASDEQVYNDQAISLARAIHPNFFVGRTTASPRMVWKISMDMSQPLSRNQGNLDATTGFVVFRLLQARAKEPGALDDEINDYRKVMALHDSFEASSDTLDLGMALWVAHFHAGKEPWADQLGGNCITALKSIFSEERYMHRSLRYRLAFREFGALLGVRCYEHDDYLEARADAVTALWEDRFPEMTPEDLRPITMVMYSASILPTAFQKNGLGQEAEDLVKY